MSLHKSSEDHLFCSLDQYHFYYLPGDYYKCSIKALYKSLYTVSYKLLLYTVSLDHLPGPIYSLTQDTTN